MTASATELRKTGGCGGCADAGAVSTQRISSGDGFLSFRTSDTQTLRFVGLGSGNAGTSANEIAFALRLQNGTAEVREAGVYKSEVSFAANDVLKIAIEGGAVKYSKNGSVFYTSTAKVSYPLYADDAFYDLNGTISNATISSGITTSNTAGAGAAGTQSGSATSGSSSAVLPRTRRRG